MSFYDFLGDFDLLNSSFMNRIKKEIGERKKNGILADSWTISQIERPELKGYSLLGRFVSDQPVGPFDPFNPFEPVDPMKRPPLPGRPFGVTERA